MIVLNSPNNPTGSVLPGDAVERVLRETRALVVCDEAYQEFGGPSAIPLLGRSSRLVVLRTFSKAMGVAGLRFGVALAHPAVAAEMAKGKLPYNVNVVTLAAATILLRESAAAGRAHAPDRGDPRAVRAEAGRAAGHHGVSHRGQLRPDPLSRAPRAEVFRRLYDDYGILVRDVSNAGELAECLRISIGTDDDMDAVILALTEILGDRPRMNAERHTRCPA